MKFNVNALFGSNVCVAPCAYCGTLFGFVNSDVLSFTCAEYPQQIIYGITCPECNNLLLLNLDQQGSFSCE